MKREELQKLFLSKEISINDYDKAVNILSLNASKDEWKKFINIALLFLGGTFFIVGVVFFFAYNWENLNKFVKLAIPFSILVLSVSITLKYDLNSLVSKASLLIAIITIGLQFTLYGQIYQTGADAWSMFFAWSLFSAGFVFVSKSSIHWVVWLIITNTTVFLYVNQKFHNDNILVSLTLFNFIALLFFSFMVEKQRLKNFKWLQEATIVYFTALYTFLLSIESFSRYGEFFKYLLFYIPIFLIMFIIFDKKNTLIIIATTVLSSVVVVTIFIMKLTNSIDNKIYLGTITLIISSTIAVKYLVKRMSSAKIN